MFDPTITLVLITAFIAAFNPYTIGVLLLLTSTSYGRGHRPGKAFSLGLAYVLTLCSISILGGAAILYLMSLLPMVAMNYLLLGVGMLIVCAGLLSMKDFFWEGQGLSMRAPHIAAQNIRALSKARPRLTSAVLLALLVAVFVTPSSGAPYFATVMMLRGNFGVDGLSLLVLYSVIFCLPMIAILLAIASGVKVSALIHWKEELKGKLRLSAGLLLIALGWILILIANGVLNFG